MCSSASTAAATEKERDRMFAVIAAICFAVALVLHLAGAGSGHLDETTFMLAGMLFLALAAIYPGWLRRP